MASFWSFLSMFMVFNACFSTLVLTSEVHVQFSTISAAPAFLPEAPSSSPPSLSPDIFPLFPTPKAGAPSPSESIVPTIPSSPSPPNPDIIMPASGPALAMSPDGSLPVSLASSGQVNLQVFIGFLVFCLLQLSFL